MYLVKIKGAGEFIVDAKIEPVTTPCGECGKPKPSDVYMIHLTHLEGTEKNQYGRGHIPFCDVKGSVREAIEADVLRQHHDMRGA